ncbi:hypothetical protein K458DRAFT_317324 [Lentithecium fluviatile CBS 122367]|uniref:DUF6594 domain-containing protein n=1 Tax=Lentithecium fluviatile CBS 122367 TaxID=1168545 RepID=A0A6G1IJR9_9PLEO|nr:hypothetical protein K458DRAFT_317324 [Lentithecium fluviatile CBS 122367]
MDLEQPPPPETSTEVLKTWKVIGYRSFSRLLASRHDFLIFRRFGALISRILLRLQNDISIEEVRLNELEAQHSTGGAADIHNGSFRREELPERSELLSRIHAKLVQYTSNTNSTLFYRPPVSRRDINSLNKWFYYACNAILDEETDYINHFSDLVQIIPKHWIPLRNFLEILMFRNF